MYGTPAAAAVDEERVLDEAEAEDRVREQRREGEELLEEHLLDPSQFAAVGDEGQRDRKRAVGKGDQERLQLAAQDAFLVQEDANADAAEVRRAMASGEWCHAPHKDVVVPPYGDSQFSFDPNDAGGGGGGGGGAGYASVHEDMRL